MWLASFLLTLALQDASAPRTPLSADLMLVAWYRRGDKANTFQYRLYRLSSEKFDTDAMYDWFMMMARQYPDHTACSRFIEIDRKSPRTPEQQIADAIEETRTRPEDEDQPKKPPPQAEAARLNEAARYTLFSSPVSSPVARARSRPRESTTRPLERSPTLGTYLHPVPWPFPRRPP